MKEEPYLLRLCVHAFSTDPGEWGNTIRHIYQSSRDLSLPQSAVGMWHDILSICLNKNESHQELSTATLSSSLISGINNALANKIIESDKQLQEFILKTSCVLLRMGFLNNDPKLSRLGFINGCVRTNAFQSTVFGETEIKDMVARIKDGLTSNRNFSNQKLLKQVLAITSTTPVAKLETIVPIVSAVLETVIGIYDQVYYDFASDKSGKLPVEFLLLFSSIEKFEKSLFFLQTRRLFSHKNVNVSMVQNIALKQSVSSDSSFAKGYLKYIHHAQTLLHFYKQRLRYSERKTSTLQELINIVSVFEKRAPKKLNLLSGVSIDIGDSITKASSLSPSNDIARMAIASQIFGRKP
jgi:hypothetical protein